MKIENALIGYSGFVGSNILRKSSFDKLYDINNIEEIQNIEFDTVVCAGAYGIKWKANKYPDEDLKSIEYLIENLKKIKTEKLILISTVNVYPVPYEVDEDTFIDIDELYPYGRHRRQLEIYVENNFNASIFRLPTIFGIGLKKNIVFDLLNNQHLDSIKKNSVYQFYNLSHLCDDIHKSMEHRINLLNIATEPISILEVGETCFNIDLSKKEKDALAPNYNMCSKHSDLWGLNQPYLYTKHDQLLEITKFVQLCRKQKKNI